MENKELTIEEQIALGTPAKVEQLNSNQVKIYLAFIQNLLSERKIHPYQPSTFVHQEAYKKLSEKDQGRVDQASVILAGYVRTLEQLLGANAQESRQIEHYIEHIWQYKERYEKEMGDIFLL